jgi:hypothetical protein
MSDTDTTIRANTAGYIACGHLPPGRHWPCARAAGHHDSHENAYTGWARQPGDDCPPEGFVGFTRADVALLQRIADANLDMLSLDTWLGPGTDAGLASLIARLVSLLPPETP